MSFSQKRRLWLTIACAAGGLVFALGGHPGSGSAAAPTTKLLVSLTPDRSNPRPLNGLRATGLIYVFAETATPAQVRFYLDDPQMQKRAAHVATRPPFDFAGHDSRGMAVALDLRRLVPGRHTVTAAVRAGKAGKGTARILRASFDVPGLFVAANGSDSAACTQAAPCKSFQRAYNVASPGQVVSVGPGQYGGQDVKGTKGEPAVVFDLGSGAAVGTLDLDADNVEFRNGKIDVWQLANPSNSATNVTMRNIDGARFFICGGSNIKVIGGDYGPNYTPGVTTIPNYITNCDSGQLPSNILIDGARIHDFRVGNRGDHLECMWIGGGTGITIRNTTFVRCDIFDVFFTQYTSPTPPSGILLENNWFDRSTADGNYAATSYTMMFAAHMNAFQNITVRYNSFLQPFLFEGNGPRTKISVIGNLGPYDGCDSGVTYAYNVWEWTRSVACSGTDRALIGPRGDVTRLGFVDPGTANLRLRPGSPAIDRGDPKDYPSRDIFGVRRPRGKAPDAGAAELR